MTELTLFSIGYEKAAQKDVLATLQAAGVRTVIDIRDRAISRRAGFSKRQLAAALDEVGIIYVHMQALGTPPEGREANRSRDWPRFWRIVEEKLAGREAELELQRAAEVASSTPACLLCYEADWRICHRRRVAELLEQRHGFSVRHLTLATGEVDEIR